MILTCDECHTRYLVPGRAIGLEGRRVRCTNCGYEWFQEGEKPEVADDEFIEAPETPPESEDVEPIPESVKPVPEGSELPAISGVPAELATIDKGRLAGYAAAVAVFLLIMGGLVVGHNMVVKLWPASIGFYDLAGIKTKVPGEDLIFDQLKAVAELNAEGIPVLTVDANILNLGHGESKVPYVQASMIDANGAVVDSWLAQPEKDVLEKDGELAFKTTYPQVPADVKEVNVKFIIGKELKEVKVEKEDIPAAAGDAPEEHSESMLEDQHEDVHGDDAAHHEEPVHH